MLAVCNEPGCPVLVEGGGACGKHRRERRRAFDRQRPTARQRGYDTRWERTRRLYLRDHPHCEHPDCTMVATDVDHIDGQGPLAPNGHNPMNLRALCHNHHSKRTARDQPGGWAA